MSKLFAYFCDARVVNVGVLFRIVIDYVISVVFIINSVVQKRVSVELDDLERRNV